MNSKIKNSLGLAAILMMVIFAVGSAIYVYYFSKSNQPAFNRSFIVAGEGEAVGVPDVARFTFSVITQGGTNITSLQTTNTTKANAIIDFLKSSQIDVKDIKTQAYSLEPRYQYYDCSRYASGACPPADIVGYTIKQTVLVTVRDFAKAGEILGGVVEKGANSVSQLSFEIDNPEGLENQARSQAIQQAKDKAQAIAQAGGFKLGQLLSIEESSYIPYRENVTYKTMDSAGAAAAPTIEPGSQEITINVVLKYAIE